MMFAVYHGAGLAIIEGTPTNGLGALEINLLFCYSLTWNDLGALCCPFKMALKWVPFEILISSPGIVACGDVTDI